MQDFLRTIKFPGLVSLTTKLVRKWRQIGYLKGNLKKREADPTNEYIIYNKEIMTKDEANALKEEKQRLYNERLAKTSMADKPAAGSASAGLQNNSA